MTLPPDVQPLIDSLRALLGIPPACSITINVDDTGTVQTVEPKVVYRRQKGEKQDDIVPRISHALRAEFRRAGVRITG